MNTTQGKRLLKLADHLEKGDLAHPVFDYGVYNYTTFDGSPDKVNHRYSDKGCGYRGCAIGELPIIWPKYFIWRFNSILVTAECPENSYEEFLGLTPEESDKIFVFGNRHYDNLLIEEVTPTHVAQWIRDFIKEKEKGK